MHVIVEQGILIITADVPVCISQEKHWMERVVWDMGIGQKQKHNI